MDKKEGVKNEEKFQEIDKKLLEIQENIQQCVGETRNILNQKKEQEEKLKKLKTELKEARIKKAKHDSYIATIGKRAKKRLRENYQF